MNILRNLVEDSIRHLSGGLGRRIRYFYYKYRLGSCGKNIHIDTGVFISSPKDIFLEDNIWIDKNVSLIAGKLKMQTKMKAKMKANNAEIEGCIFIGSNSHIGIGTIIQGHGGVKIGKNFTTSAGAKIYSLSNDVNKSTEGTNNIDKTKNKYILSPIVLKDNVWLGINVILLGGIIENNCFIQPFSIVTKDVKANSIVGGNPAKFIELRFK